VPAVIGAGVMGSGIAAHLANAGVEVLLLDIVPPNLSDAEKKAERARNRFAASGLDKALKARPAAFFHKDGARLVSSATPRTTSSEARRATSWSRRSSSSSSRSARSSRSSRRSWRPLHRRVEHERPAHRGDDEGALEGSSALPRDALLQPGPLHEAPRARGRPRHVDRGARRVAASARTSLGKGIVLGKDTPNFVGNRIGIHAMLTTIHLMLEEGLAPEDVDAITGEPMGTRRARASARRTSSASTRSCTSPTTATRR
jgi:3-hydroxyacyl-CoA dehydrogenase